MGKVEGKMETVEMEIEEATLYREDPSLEAIPVPYVVRYPVADRPAALLLWDGWEGRYFQAILDASKEEAVRDVALKLFASWRMEGHAPIEVEAMLFPLDEEDLAALEEAYGTPLPKEVERLWDLQELLAGRKGKRVVLEAIPAQEVAVPLAVRSGSLEARGNLRFPPEGGGYLVALAEKGWDPRRGSSYSAIERLPCCGKLAAMVSALLEALEQKGVERGVILWAEGFPQAEARAQFLYEKDSLASEALEVRPALEG